jgi:hypothetical protein
MPFHTAKSSFLRRLLRARDDPVKQSVLTWLTEIDDAGLLKFGLALGDIAIIGAIKDHNNRATDITEGDRT